VTLDRVGIPGFTRMGNVVINHYTVSAMGEGEVSPRVVGREEQERTDAIISMWLFRLSSPAMDRPTIRYGVRQTPPVSWRASSIVRLRPSSS
jgi:hypothetical protein